jgi:putative SbcD/Mre11-related phosphoesterase
VSLRVHDHWLLTPERTAVYLPSATAVVADPHLGYDRARRRTGEAVPPVRVAETLAPLRAVVARHGCARLVIAGDLFEAGWCPTLAEELRAWLDEAGVELLAVVPGNHDRGLEAAGDLLPVRTGGLELGGWRVVHGDGDLPEGRLVFGHFHPWLRWGQVSAPCYLVGEDCIVLPALSPDARGASVRRVPEWRRLRCCAVAGDEVLDLGPLGALWKRGGPRPTRRTRTGGSAGR